jgi:hypothetical protein
MIENPTYSLTYHRLFTHAYITYAVKGSKELDVRQVAIFVAWCRDGSRISEKCVATEHNPALGGSCFSAMLRNECDDKRETRH